MWGQNWGQMIWGGATRVPALNVVALLVLGALLLGLGIALGRSKGLRAGAVVLLILLVPFLAVAQSLITFSNGTVADANQVNANFTAVTGAIQGLQIDCTNVVSSFSVPPNTPATLEATCPAGRTMTGGGADTQGGPGVQSRELYESYPVNATTWQCSYFNSSTTNAMPITCIARCCRLQ